MRNNLEEYSKSSKVSLFVKHTSMNSKHDAEITRNYQGYMS